MQSVKAISISSRKGMRKKNIDATVLIEGFGLKDDAHGGKWHRQVSFLAEESIETMRNKGLDVVAGNFAENITTQGVDLTKLRVGQHLRIGATELVISQLGKICHTRCAIYHQAGDCVMPREGIFGVIVRGGEIQVGDKIEMQNKQSTSCALLLTEQMGETAISPIIESLQNTFSPVFTRVDTVNDKEGGSLEEILEDLTKTQAITNVVILDPSGNGSLSLAGLPPVKDGSAYQKNDSTVHYCKEKEEVQTLSC